MNKALCAGGGCVGRAAAMLLRIQEKSVLEKACLKVGLGGKHYPGMYSPPIHSQIVIVYTCLAFRLSRTCLLSDVKTFPGNLRRFARSVYLKVDVQCIMPAVGICKGKDE